MGHGNDLETKMNGYFEKAFDNSIEVDIDGVTVSTMCATDHYSICIRCRGDIAYIGAISA